MKFNFLLCCLFFTAVTSFAQISNVTNAAGIPLSQVKYDKVEGSPYLNGDQWSRGDIYWANNTISKDVQIRYNAYEDEVEVLNNNKPYIYETKDIIKFEIESFDPVGKMISHLFVNISKFEELNKGNEFFRVISDHNDLKVLEKIFVSKIRVTPAAYGESDYEKFVIDRKTYITTKGELEKSNLNKRAFMKAFPEHKSEIKNYIKERKVNFSEDKEISDLCDYIISLKNT